MHIIDCQGLRCPMPLLKAKLAFASLLPGQGFQILADDPAAGPDIRRWADRVHASVTQQCESPLTLEVKKTRA